MNGLESLEGVLKKLCDNDVIIAVYSRDFKILWGSLEDHQNIQRRCHYSIIWDKTPPSKDDKFVDTSVYLSPIEWSICARQKWKCVSVTVLDLNPSIHMNCPHYSLYNMIDTKKIQWLRVLNPSMMVNKSIENLKYLFNFPTVDSSQLSSEFFLKQISFQLASGSDSNRHSISNIVGPILLMGAYWESESFHSYCLKILLTFCGLFVQNQEKGRIFPHLKGITSEKLLLLGNRIILVDDQWRHGWADWVSKLLDVPYQELDSERLDSYNRVGTKKCEFLVTDSPDILIRSLRAMKGDDKRFRFKNIDDETNEILLLDLRLFSARSIVEEAKFFLELVDLCHPYIENCKSGNPNFAWAGFSESEINAVSSWCQGVLNNDGRSIRESESHWIALTLLPRLIALKDISYPVVIFSSTGRTEVIKRLIPYGNIITQFEKPRFNELLSNNMVGEVCERFFNAMTRASELLDARRLCKNIPEVIHRPLATNENNGSWKIELYIDETGSEFNKNTGTKEQVGSVKIGGILAIYGPNKNPDAFNAQLAKELISIIEATNDKKNALKIKANYIANWINNCSSNIRPDHITFVTLGSEYVSDAEGLGFLEYPGAGDNLYRETISYLIEIAIYHHIKINIPKDSDVEYKVIISTRQYPIDTPLKKLYAEALCSSWGIKTKFFNNNDEIADAAPNSEYLIYLDTDSARPIIQQIARQYRFCRFRPRAEQGRADSNNNFTIKYIKERPLHYVVDAFLCPIGPHNMIEEMLVNNGFSGRVDEKLKTLLHACRLNDEGFPGKALTVAAAHLKNLSLNTKRDACNVLTLSLADAKYRISGEEYRQFIDEMGKGGKYEVSRSKHKTNIIVKSYDKGCRYFIYHEKKQIDIYPLSLPYPRPKNGAEIEYILICGNIPGQNYAKIINK